MALQDSSGDPELNTAYSVVFKFSDPRVMDAQQAEMLGNLDDDGNPIPNPKNYFSRLLQSKFWSSSGQSHQHERDRILAEFSFETRRMPASTERERLLEAAVFDMYGWLQTVGLADIEPVVVEMRRSQLGEGISPHQDMTLETIAIIGRLAHLKTLEPRDFTE